MRTSGNAESLGKTLVPVPHAYGSYYTARRTKPLNFRTRV